MTNDQDTVPVFQTHMNPVLAALRANRGKPSIKKLDKRTAREMNLSTDVCGTVQ